MNIAAHKTRSVRLLAADDEHVLRQALADLAELEPRIQLVGLASDADQAIALARRHRPDVALLDVRMPGGGGPAAARGIRACSPATLIVAYSAYDDRGSVMEMLRAGAVGYVVKGTIENPIAAAIRAADGERVLSSEALVEVVGELTGRLERDDRETLWRNETEEQTRRAITGEGMSFVYQPIVDIAGGTLWGVEALARFAADPYRTPDAWFNDANAVGLLSQLECAAIVRAVQGLDAVPTEAFMSVNVSPATLVGPEFNLLIARLPLQRLILEITEHAYVEDYDRLRYALSDAQARGARIAIDDAGAGFASLRHIVQMEPKIIKLDMSLVRGIDADPARRALASGLVSFATDTGAIIVAEGIESPGELQALRSLGVTHGQGYYLCRPGPLPAPASYPVTRLEDR